MKTGEKHIGVLKSLIRSFFVIILMVNLNHFASAQGLSFTYNERYDSLRLMFLGDITQSGSQITHAFDPVTRSYRYDSCLFYVQPLLALGDLVIGNLETTFSGPAYSGMPYYSAPDELAKSLKLSGVNVLMTANDHCMDRGADGLKRTLMVLDGNKIAHTGTFASKEERSDKFPLLIEKYGFKIAILNYTATVRQPEKGNVVVNKIDRNQIEADLLRLLEYGPDYTVVYFHWGTEYQRFPNLDQKELAQFCFDLGADLVVGSNPHVLQRIEELEYVSKGVLKKGLVAYSLGNFLSDYDRRFGDGAAVLEVVLAKDKQSKVCSMAEYGFVPTYVSKDNQSGKKVTQVIPVSEVERGNITVPMSLREFELMKISGRDNRLMLNAPNCLEIKYPINDNIVNDVMETIILTQAPVNKDRSGGDVMGKIWDKKVTTSKDDSLNQIAQTLKRNEVSNIQRDTIEFKDEKVAPVNGSNNVSASVKSQGNQKTITEKDPSNIVSTSTDKLNKSETKELGTASKMVNSSMKEGNNAENKSNETKSGIAKENPIYRSDTVKSSTLVSNRKYDTLDVKEKIIKRDTLKLAQEINSQKSPSTVVPDTQKIKNQESLSESQKVVKTYVGEAYAPVDSNKILMVSEQYESADQQVEKLKEQFKGYQISYRVKFYDMRTKVEINTFYYKYLEGYEAVWSGSTWTYYLGNTMDFTKAKDTCILLRSKGLKAVEIIPFIGTKKLDWKIDF